MSLWGGRFKKNINQDFEKFNKSLHIDYILIKEDIITSIAWSKSLLQAKIISHQEQIKIEAELNKLLIITNKNPKKILCSKEEDIHSWVENRLVENIGPVGKKIHTGRSRNDQITTDLKIWCKKNIKKIYCSIIQFQEKLVKIAEKNSNTIMSGYTHLQRAQPIIFGHWCLAYYEMMQRDKSRLQDSFSRLNTCPLGSGALAGNSWNIDRMTLSKNLNFLQPTKNSLDSVSDRDYVIDIVSAASISMLHLSRFAEDLIFFSSGESKFIELDDEISSGSSLMPQKKNPDILEIIRSKCGKIYGLLINILVIFKGLPLSYNKDMQEDKEILFNTIHTWNSCIKMSALTIKKIKINKKKCLLASKSDYSNATELANYLVTKGIPFRESHNITGNIVLYAIKNRSSLENLKISDFKKYHSLIENDVYDFLKIDKIIEKYNSYGGTSINQVKKSIKQAKKEILKSKKLKFT